ncbi:EAL domain-containing protein [Azonexus sp.]|uniref:EAL domain-containing protein n=1 Tax=Azonexus sp. TaxID=1872668 RepID=UPI0027BA69B2|nr:EAL domain-containing protein [Azonexus sp.]
MISLPEVASKKPKKNKSPTTGNAPLEAPQPRRRYLVGIGASAGGLEALSALISCLPIKLGLCYVVVQHLSPTYRSMLVQLLSRDTAMAVKEIEDGCSPEPDTIFITPASSNVTMLDGCFHLVTTSRKMVPKPSVNVFLTSLAEQYGEDGIGIILSGTGSDGSQGIREVKAVGGFTFAQEPASAKYNGMPQSAIDTGCVDWILPPDQIAQKIAAIADSREHLSPPEKTSGSASTLKQLLMKVRQRTKVDFSGYKENTVWRRIERRMAANHLSTLEDYFRYVDADPEELEHLSKDILISVTAFFRDKTAFEALAKTLLKIVQDKRPGDEIRIWIAGCATGEEVYSIAILLCEQAEPVLNRFKIQIFATDLDLNAMATARKGTYSAASLSELEAPLIAKYFSAKNDSYEISKVLRDMVVFARQDLAQDPPFLRLDLISCRNVLIYFQTDLQAKILSMFHYALRPEGYLFLGRSENIYQQDSLFRHHDKDAKIFLRKNVLNRPPFTGGAFTLPPPEKTAAAIATNSAKTGEFQYLDAASRFYLPPGVLINAGFDILHLYGNPGEYLNIADGKPTFDLLHMIRNEFGADLQTLTHQAQHKKASAFGRPRALKLDGGKRIVRLAVHHLSHGNLNGLFLICFEPAPKTRTIEGPASGGDHVSGWNVKELEDELVATREHLQAVIEELETSNEEMQALNEEVQAANEELQSSNEELEAANEELQSTNEELTTVNEELQVKSGELAEIAYDIENVQNCIGFPLFVVNRELEIERFNRPAADLLSLDSTMVGQRTNRIKRPRGMGDFGEAIRQVINEGKPVETMLASENRHYILHVTPNFSPTGVRGAIVFLIDNTELHAAEVAARNSQEKMMAIMDNSHALSSLKDPSGRYIFVNRRFIDTFDVTSENALGKTDRQLFPRAIADEFRRNDLEAMKANDAVEFEECIETPHGERIFLSVRFPLHDADGVVYAVCTQSTDITARKDAENQLRLTARVFDHSGEGIVITNRKGIIMTVNKAFVEVTGYTEREVIGKMTNLLSSGKHGHEYYTEMWQQIDSKGWWQGEIWNKRKNGEIYPEWLTINSVKDTQGEILHYVGIFSDISVVKESQKRIEYLATHDELTGLPNRALYIDRLKQAIAKAGRSKTQIAVMFVDVDNFKIVNDSMGHDVGDLLLRQVTGRLAECVRAGDTVARFGGDEFTILLENTRPTEVSATAERIINQLSLPHILDDRKLYTTASIGICMYPDDGMDTQTLLKCADIAMYRAKDSGKNNFQFFTEELKALTSERMFYASDLRQALERGQLYLVYQPQIDMNTGLAVGLEALLRWRHPERGLVPPSRFIPVAEETGLIEVVGEWVLESVCQQIAAWKSVGLEPPRISVNISSRQLRKAHFPEKIELLLSKFGLGAESLALEFTEHALLENVDYVLAMITQLKSQGLHLSLDDFGTGYSSLSYLKRYSLDEIKIDRSFVDGIANEPHDRAIATAIIAMASALDIRVVAEGVENEEQKMTLLASGCSIAQGYLFAKPLTVGEVEVFFGGAPRNK